MAGLDPAIAGYLKWVEFPGMAASSAAMTVIEWLWLKRAGLWRSALWYSTLRDRAAE